MAPVNVDEYTVNITQMPLAANVVANPLSLDNPARRATPAELVQRIRTKFNSFVDSRLAGFEPYDLVPDAAIWSLQVPLGAVIHIDMRDPRGAVFPFNNPDDGSVCVTAAGPEYWRFSTLATPADGEHPVSGNREFGIEPWGPAGTFRFYVRGADRATGAIDWVVQNEIWAAAHALWLSCQARVTTFVNQTGGVAEPALSVSERHDWDKYEVQSQYQPTEAWL